MTEPENDMQWSPDPDFPQEPEFYRRALHHLQVPIVVVDGTGTIRYANAALLALGGWNVNALVGVNMLTFVHPEDRQTLASAFVDIVQSPEARVLSTDGEWAEIYFRIVTATGDNVPIELIGSGGLLDPHINGIIYTVRPAHTRSLLGRVLDGLSQGASMHHLLSLVAEMIASTPLDLDAVILQSTPHGGFLVASSTSPVLTEAFRSWSSDLPWAKTTLDPAFVAVRDLPDDMANRLLQAGYNDVWYVSVDSPLVESTLRIIGISPTHHVPANGPKNRLVRARELASAVLLRSQADVLLDYAAGRDSLTDLPNRAAFYQLTESVNPTHERAALHLDLDGLKMVNDEHGQVVGDAVLQIVADRIRAACRQSDVIGRLGDDEFAVLLTSESEIEPLAGRALSLAADVLDAVGETIVVAGRPLSISASVGVSVAPSGIGTDQLLTWSDAAMHDAKRQGGGRICRFGGSFG